LISGCEALIQPANLTRHERFDSVGLVPSTMGSSRIAKFALVCAQPAKWLVVVWRGA